MEKLTQRWMELYKTHHTNFREKQIYRLAPHPHHTPNHTDFQEMCVMKETGWRWRLGRCGEGLLQFHSVLVQPLLPAEKRKKKVLLKQEFGDSRQCSECTQFMAWGRTRRSGTTIAMIAFRVFAICSAHHLPPCKDCGSRRPARAISQVIPSTPTLSTFRGR